MTVVVQGWQNVADESVC